MIWDVSSGTCIQTLEGHSDRVTSVVFSPDGKCCLTGSRDGTAKIWDVASGECLQTLEGHSDRVTSVVFSPDGKYGLTESDDGTAKIWDADFGKCLQTLKEQIGLVMSVYFSSDGKYCLTSLLGNTAKLWDVTSGGSLRTVILPRENNNDLLFWSLPYGCVEHNGTLKVYKIDFDNHVNNGGVEYVEYIDTFYDVDVYLKQCVFRDISADETVRKILYQYGAELDVPH